MQAIDAAKALQNSGTGNRNKQIAQFYCELAEDELVNTHPEKALPLLETALSTDRMSVRATILTGDALVALGKPEEALATWRRVEKQSISHTVLVAQRLMEGFQSVGRPQEGISLLKSYLSETASIDLLEVLFKAVLKQEGVEAANTLVHDELRRTPTLLGLDKLLEAQLLVVPPEIREDLSFVRNLVQRYASRLSRYQCSHCGFEARQFYWQCPGCHQWETYPPKRVEEMKLSS